MACHVLPGLYGIAVQGFLFLTSLGVLVAKWLLERRSKAAPRPFLTFVLDGSKQLVGAGWIHITNLLFARALSSLENHGDQCEWYWINIMVDTTVGCLVEYGLLRAVNEVIQRVSSPEKAREWVESGDYFDADSNFKWMRYAKQLVVWVLVVVTGMKAAMVLLMLCLQYHFMGIAASVLKPFLHDPQIKLLVVMILTPCIMNAVQFWLVDNILRNKGKGETYETYGKVASASDALVKSP